VIELDNAPELVDPILVAAFEGWNDAGESASGAIGHLDQAWNAKPLASLAPDDYYDFQVTRPTVEIVDGVSKAITWPTTRLTVARPEGSERDIVLVHGIEPNMRWRAFCDDLLGVVRDLGIEQVLLLGALLADAPHTRPVPITAAFSDPGAARTFSIEPARYEGPTGIAGVFHNACADAGLDTVSLWAAVPHYVAQPPCPKGTLALLRGVEDVLDMTLPLGDLPEQARAWERGVDELASQDTEVAEYVRSLEEQKDAAELPEATGEAIAREFERYLRRRGPKGGDS
jgi:hypothetical protein